MKLSELTEALKSAGIDEGRHEALVLFRHFTSLPEYTLRLDDPECDSAELADAARRRCAREPLQYILAEAAFYRETYKVTPAVLIPRADTEGLVDAILPGIRRGGHLLDLCTGSGCVGISSLLHSENTRATLVDLSPAALDVARENAGRYHLEDRVDYLLLDVLHDFPTGNYDVIASNPPYIPREVYEGLAPEIHAEPQMAFVAEEDGMAFYRAILERGRAHLNPDGYFAFEFGFDQKEKMLSLAKEYGMSAEIRYDLGANPRIAILK